MTISFARLSNGVEICFETIGRPEDPPLLLVMGFGSQMTSWDVEFVESFAALGFYVIRYDHRDCGLSTKFEVPALSPEAVQGGEERAPYSLAEMSDDGVLLLDELHIDTAHVLGVSMGGMIAQLIAIQHPDRVLSLCSIMSTTGAPGVGRPRPEVLAAAATQAATTRTEVIEASVAASRLYSGGGYQFDEDAARRRATANYDRSYYPAGRRRHMLAVRTACDRTEALSKLSMPTVVIHGDSDPLIAFSGGEATVAAIPGSRFVPVQGLGHEIPVPARPTILAEFAANAAVAQYKISMNDPKGLTRAFRTLWSARGALVKATFTVSDCPFSADDLEQLTVSGRRVGYLPPALAASQSRWRLGEIFPLMRCYSLLKENVVANDESRGGWFDYTVAVDAPYTELDETELATMLEEEASRLLSLNEYIIAGQDHKLFSGQYLDERSTFSRVGSRVDGRMVAVRFDGDEMAVNLGAEVPVPGSLLVAYDIEPGDKGHVLGARTSSITEGRSDVVADPGAVTLTPLKSAYGYPKSMTELDAEWNRLVDIYVRNGFPAELNLSDSEYRQSIPRFSLQPAAFAGRLDVPLIVEPRISWKRQAELSDISLSGTSLRIEYTPADSASAEPTAPYCAWMSDWGQRHRSPIAPGEARFSLAEDEAGASMVELVAMILAHPEQHLSGRFFEAIGYVMQHVETFGLAGPGDSGRTPCVFLWRGRPEIGVNLHPIEFSMFRPLVRGRLAL
ncbi:alpha/beta fold hydrolase [Rhodococcus sp. KBS0724]|uniref:alpha/beta fold hydrolase n=1 Tax=Rhodococcus sp. KBS0724 TaxID=1179674 RepID=UPI00110F0F8A|nr:alpha/beta hydrolase [Rhodococcus sp. KBS0724]TSD40351.1 alpha/beta fold hydrolase [Rhodococcus sp. KBS0724]